MENRIEQASIPGIDTAAYDRLAKAETYKQLLANNPHPDTYEKADKFLRQYTTTILTMRLDSDDMRVVLKQKNSAENREKHEYTAELNATDREAWEAEFIEIAIKAYLQWVDLEAPKFSK